MPLCTNLQCLGSLQSILWTTTVFAVSIHPAPDLFDGYGSYPEVLNRSNVFVNVGRIGILYYLLFQHHTNFELAAADGYFGGTEQLKTFNFTRQLGPNTAVVMVDARTERTLDQCVSPASWSMIEDRLMNGLAPTTKHLLFVSGVPVRSFSNVSPANISSTTTTTHFSTTIHHLL